MKNDDRAGTYRPIFKVVSADANKDANVKITTKDQLLKELETLSNQKQQEKDPDKIEGLLSQIGDLLELGKRESWITVAEARLYLKEDDQEPSSVDALAHIVCLIHKNEF